jgi:glyoxylase-like metal-dependent hydrolase (beta-lactamase superfamily II)
MSNSLYQELNDGIFRIDAEYQRPGFACSYLLREGDEAVLIDTGTNHSVPTVMELLQQQGLKPEQVKYVMPTHVHLDHAGGVGELMRQLPEAQLVVHPFGSRHMIDPSKLQAGATAVYGEAKFKEDFGELIAVPEERVLETADNFSIELNGRKLACLDTPGHARHHYCVYDEQSSGFFSGDTFGISYRDFDSHNGQFISLPSTPVQFDPDAWHKTIDRLMSYSPKYMYLTHFGRIENLQPMAEKLHSDLDAYVEICKSVSKENRYEQLVAGLKALYIEQLKLHECILPQEQQEKLLSLDLDINAQGLEVWMQRQEKVGG